MRVCSAASSQLQLDSLSLGEVCAYDLSQLRPPLLRHNKRLGAHTVTTTTTACSCEQGCLCNDCKMGGELKRLLFGRYEAEREREREWRYPHYYAWPLVPLATSF